VEPSCYTKIKSITSSGISRLQSRKGDNCHLDNIWMATSSDLAALFIESPKHQSGNNYNHIHCNSVTKMNYINNNLICSVLNHSAQPVNPQLLCHMSGVKRIEAYSLPISDASLVYTTRGYVRVDYHTLCPCDSRLSHGDVTILITIQ